MKPAPATSSTEPTTARAMAHLGTGLAILSALGSRMLFWQCRPLQRHRQGCTAHRQAVVLVSFGAEDTADAGVFITILW